jgi:hypothetical protein
VTALDDGDLERADREKKEGPEPSIFQVRRHGVVLKIAGKTRNARLRLGQRPGKVARFLIDNARDFSDGNPRRLKQIWTSYFALTSHNLIAVQAL